MAFSSINPPLYLDPPNWQQQQPPQPQQQQQQQHQQQQTNQTHHENNLHHHPHHHLPPPSSQQPQVVGDTSSGGGTGGSGSAGSIKPGSMTDRARLAKLPQPEQALKCPRCDSTNTKFCYFNNYSLSQPRHFCKTCRRYWTRGGALRNVPVGGGCRRNKRSSKSSNSNNSSSSNKSSMATTTSSSSSIQISNSSNSTDHLNCHLNPSQLSNQLPNFMASLHHFGTDYGAADHLGLNFNHQPITGAGGGDQFQMGISSNLGGGGTDHQQWRFQQMQQFPFMGTLETPLGLYPFQDQGIDAPNSITKQQPSAGSSNSSLVSQFASVKMEESHQHGLNLSRQFLANINHQGGGGGGNGSNDHQQHQYWNTNTSSTGNAWTDLAGFNSSSTSHLL